MTLIRTVVKEYCEARDITQHADRLEDAVRFARDNNQSNSLNKTVRIVLDQYKDRLRQTLKGGPK